MERRRRAHVALVEDPAADDQVDGIVLENVGDELDREFVRDELQVDGRRKDGDGLLADDHLRDRLGRDLGRDDLGLHPLVGEVARPLGHPEGQVLEVVVVRDEDANVDGLRHGGWVLRHRRYKHRDFRRKIGEHRRRPSEEVLVRSTALLLFVLPLALLAGCDSCNDKSTSGTTPSASVVAST